MGWGMNLRGFGSVMGALDALSLSFDDDVMYVTGTNVEYAVHLEAGTRGHPPYPFVRPAVSEFKANPERFIGKNADIGIAEAAMRGEEALVKTVALAFESQIKRNVTAAGGGPRSPGTDPEHPRRQTGNLAASIRAVRID